MRIAHNANLLRYNFRFGAILNMTGFKDFSVLFSRNQISLPKM